MILFISLVQKQYYCGLNCLHGRLEVDLCCTHATSGGDRQRETAAGLAIISSYPANKKR